MTREILEATTRIDYCMYMLKHIYIQLFECSPIERMVDKATGYEESLIKDGIDACDSIIADKTLLGIDTSKEVELKQKFIDYES